MADLQTKIKGKLVALSDSIVSSSVDCNKIWRSGPERSTCFQILLLSCLHEILARRECWSMPHLRRSTALRQRSGVLYSWARRCPFVTDLKDTDHTIDCGQHRAPVRRIESAHPHRLQCWWDKKIYALQVQTQSTTDDGENNRCHFATSYISTVLQSQLRCWMPSVYLH